MFRSRLNLSAEHNTQIESLQKEVDGRLDKIFNDEQKAQWKITRSRRTGGPPGRREAFLRGDACTVAICPRWSSTLLTTLERGFII
jgi:hypothetical protein